MQKYSNASIVPLTSEEQRDKLVCVRRWENINRKDKQKNCARMQEEKERRGGEQTWRKQEERLVGIAEEWKMSASARR